MVPEPEFGFTLPSSLTGLSGQADLERDRTAANRKYDRAGLVEVDRLFSFTLRGAAPER
ncbi:hypothetical protein WJ438_37025 [Streptomyces sp. GD-15H]|uniref:hypothetical protein n=1 Tax=Streptomyces sp. GD-15H TaxID=3129112 RepID=UPI0032489242